MLHIYNMFNKHIFSCIENEWDKWVYFFGQNTCNIKNMIFYTLAHLRGIDGRDFFLEQYLSTCFFFKGKWQYFLANLVFVSKILNLLNNGQHFLYLHVELMCNLLTIQPPSVLIYKQLLLTELMEYYFCHKIPINQK